MFIVHSLVSRKLLLREDTTHVWILISQDPILMLFIIVQCFWYPSNLFEYGPHKTVSDSGKKKSFPRKLVLVLLLVVLVVALVAFVRAVPINLYLQKTGHQWLRALLAVTFIIKEGGVSYCIFLSYGVPLDPKTPEMTNNVT